MVIDKKSQGIHLVDFHLTDEDEDFDMKKRDIWAVIEDKTNDFF
jgi:hypothetical protein